MRIYQQILAVATLVLMMGGCGEERGLNTEQNMDNSSPYSIVKIKSKIANNEIEISWEDKANAKSYLLEYGLKDEGFTQSILLDADTLSYKVTNLEEGSIYLFRLKRLLVDENELYSETIQVKTATSSSLRHLDDGPKL